MKSPLRLALLGHGTVGSAVATLLAEKVAVLTERCGRGVELCAVMVRNREKYPHLGKLLVADFSTILDDADIDVVIETIGGLDPARSYIESALRRGKSVITANKELMATWGPELMEIATASSARLRYEAAVGAGIPLVSTLEHSLTVNRIDRIEAVLNGTSNFILNAMEDGISFDAALADAQQRGYAEYDPSADIDGRDSLFKIALLAAAAFGSHPDMSRARCEGIRSLSGEDIGNAKAHGCRIKLVATATRVPKGAITVQPTRVPLDSPLAHVHGVDNAVLFHTDVVGPLLIRGAGAGGLATASGIIDDLVAIATEARS